MRGLPTCVLAQRFETIDGTVGAASEIPFVRSSGGRYALFGSASTTSAPTTSTPPPESLSLARLVAPVHFGDACASLASRSTRDRLRVRRDVPPPRQPAPGRLIRDLEIARGLR